MPFGHRASVLVLFLLREDMFNGGMPVEVPEPCVTIKDTLEYVVQ